MLKDAIVLWATKDSFKDKDSNQVIEYARLYCILLDTDEKDKVSVLPMKVDAWEGDYPDSSTRSQYPIQAELLLSITNENKLKVVGFK